MNNNTRGGLQTLESATATTSSKPQEPPINPPDPTEGRRLWLGNLDPKLTDTNGFHLLKLIQRFGPIQQFDFLFHRNGPNVGQPRGYAFVTFTEPSGAERCLRDLDGKRILERTISIRWANQTPLNYLDEEEKLKKRLPALGIGPSSSQSGQGHSHGKGSAYTSASSSNQSSSAGVSTSTSSITKSKTISAIEAKLRAMENEKLNFNLIGVKSGNSNSTGPSTSNFTNFSSSSTAGGVRLRSSGTNNSNNNKAKPYDSRNRRSMI